MVLGMPRAHNSIVRWMAFILRFPMLLSHTVVTVGPLVGGFVLPHLQTTGTAERASWILGRVWIPVLCLHRHDGVEALTLRTTTASDARRHLGSRTSGVGVFQVEQGR